MTKSAGPALRQLHREFGDRVEFLTLYVREAHPGDRYVQPHDAQTKLRQAKEYVQRDGISWPVLVDDVDGHLHRRLDPKPDAVYVVGADGTVVFRALWANHEPPLRRALEHVAAGRSEQLGDSEAKLIPLLSGTGTMWETLRAAGPVALRDVAREAPPMWIAARLAGLLRPLPPVGRGLVAAAVLALVPAAAVGALRRQRVAGRSRR